MSAPAAAAPVAKEPTARYKGCRFCALSGMQYLFFLISGLVMCKENDTNLCIIDSCSQTCSTWWLITVGAVGFFRVFFMSLIIVLTRNCFNTTTHNNCLYLTNYIVGISESVLFYIEFAFIIYIGYPYDSRWNLIHLWIFTISLVIVQFIFRIHKFISNRVKRSKASSVNNPENSV
jgi:hypothetical protein